MDSRIKPTPDLTICITTWNAGNSIEDTMMALATELRRVGWRRTRVMVFDQGSTDNTRHYLCTKLDLPCPVTLHLADGNQGQSVSRNHMVRNSNSRYVLFLDGDIVPIPGSIEHMAEHLDEAVSVPGIYYDVRGDTYDPETATGTELPLTEADLTTATVPMFHYAMYRREFIAKHLLPEFYPFDGPGWGVEEEVTGLQCPGAVFDVIRHRKFYHCRAGRSSNFLREELAESRCRRWFTWQALKRESNQVIQRTFEDKLPLNLQLNLANGHNRDTLLTEAAVRATSEFMPYQFKAETDCKRQFLLQHELDFHKVEEDKHYVVLPWQHSPVWLLANLPAVATDSDKEPWHFFGGEVISDLNAFCQQVSNHSGVIVRDVRFHWLACLLGIPSQFDDSDNDPDFPESELLALEELGLKPEMTLVDVKTYRRLVQDTCLERVIVPLTGMLVSERSGA
jgi:glycosyltransferase involved in cell wall biosynthesis